MGDDVLPLLSKSELAPCHCTVQVMKNQTIPLRCEIICRVELIPPVICSHIPHSTKGYLEPRQLEMGVMSVARTLKPAKNRCAVARIINPIPVFTVLH